MSSKKNQVALLSATTPSAAIQLVKDKLSQYENISDSMYKTKKRFDAWNIETETSIPELIKALSSIKARKTAYDAAADELVVAGTLTNYPVFQIEGSTYEEWAADIALRIKIINHKQTIDKLNKVKDGLEKLMTDEDRMAILLKELENIQ